MKLLKLYILLSLLVIGLNVNIAFSQKPTVSLTSGGATVVRGFGMRTPASSATPRGTQLDAMVNFGDVSPENSRLIQITVPVRISASTAYKVELQRLPANAVTIRPENIGLSIQNIRAETSNPEARKYRNSVSGAIITGRFAGEISTVSFHNGRPQYPATLADISEYPTIILTGVPTTSDQDLTKYDSAILINLTFTIASQYYKPTENFNLPLLITISPL